jgi:kynurenine formamidase
MPSSPEPLGNYKIGDAVETHAKARAHWRRGTVTIEYVPLGYLGITLSLTGAQINVADPALVRRA